MPNGDERLNKIEGYLLSLDNEERAIQMAAHFCDLNNECQAKFFNSVALISDGWKHLPEGRGRVFQWRDTQRFLSPDGKRVIDEFKDHTDED